MNIKDLYAENEKAFLSVQELPPDEALGEAGGCAATTSLQTLCKEFE